MTAAVATQWATSNAAAASSQQAGCSSRTAAAAATTSASAHRSSSKSSRSGEYCDRFYGHRELAELCERVIMALFACPLDSASTSVSASTSARAAPRLSEFIAYALHRTRLPLAVTHQALFLLKRLKTRFPAARGSSGHRLFISALMLASKSSCDDTYSNKSWTIVGQGLFSLREVNQMERELFGYLGFRVNVENEELVEFVAGLEQGRISAGAPTPAAAAPAPRAAVEVEAPAPVAPAPRSAPVVAVSSPATVEKTVAASPSTTCPVRPPRSARSSISGYPTSSSSASASAPCVATSTLQRSASVSVHQPQAAHSFHNLPFGARERSRPYTTPTHSVALTQAAAAAAAAKAAAHTAAFYSHLSPSTASLASSRGSISSDDSRLTPSTCGSSAYTESSSGCTTPDTPPSELDASPWTEDKASLYCGDSQSIGGEPAGTYDDQVKYYHNTQAYAAANARQAYPSAQSAHPYSSWP